MGIRVSVYRDASLNSDCTNNGVSGRHTSLTVVNVDGPSEPTPDAPAVLLVPGVLGGYRIVPAHKSNKDEWVMFGGNYAYTFDSRFRQAIKDHGPVPIHDRVE